MRLSHIIRLSVSKNNITEGVSLSELDILVSNYEKSLANPLLFPTHIQKLHNLALQVRSEREFLGISQFDLEPNKLSLKKAEKVIYAIYDQSSPEFYFVASREPAAFDFYKLYLNSIKKTSLGQYNSILSKWISKYDFNSLGIYLVESLNTTKVGFREIAKARLLFWRSRFLGPGHATCKPLPVPTQDGPNKYIKFKLRKIRRDFWNVLCFANSEKLRNTAYELIKNYKKNNKSLKYLEFIQEYSYDNKDEKDKFVMNKNQEDNNEENNKQTNNKNKNKEDKQNKTRNKRNEDEKENTSNSDSNEQSEDKLYGKTKGFWIVYSKRFKESMHILSVSDIATILKSFHLYNRDTGEYVVAVLELQRRVGEMDARSFLDCLWVLSKRLKLNTQKEFFKQMANHVPNILYSLSCFDIVKVIWNLYNAGYTDVEICRRVYPKFLEHMDDLSEQDLSAACLAFGRFGYRNIEFYSKIESRISKNCNSDTLFQMCWGLHMATIDVTNLVAERTETLVNSLEGSPRWKVQVWKNILNSTNCKTSLKKTVDKYL